jgi:thiamine biosynthesis lipoprotein
MVRHVERVMGTVFSFDLRDPDVDEGALADAVAWLHWVDATFSTYRDDSDVSRLDRGEVRLEQCAPELQTVLDLCATASEASGGFFTATVDGRLDPSGLVKGWSVEEVSRRLERAGSRRHSISAGGDIRVVGGGRPGQPWRVGVAHPLRPGELAAVVSITDGAVATSGTAERGAHVVNPHTGRPATALASVTVVGPDLTWADAHATAAVARGSGARAWLAGLGDYEAIGITAEGLPWWTPGFPAYGVVPHRKPSGGVQQPFSHLAEA